MTKNNIKSGCIQKKNNIKSWRIQKKNNIKSWRIQKKNNIKLIIKTFFYYQYKIHNKIKTTPINECNVLRKRFE